MAEAFYQQVVDPFVQGYLRGLTPNPCISCNRCIRFGLLYHKALELECQAVATGHYARITYQQGRYHLLQGRDRGKDQSYMLYSANQQQLAMTIYPLGDFTKTEARHLAAQRGLKTAARPESQDICFVPEGDYAALIEQLAPQASQPGPILYHNGQLIGQHRGLIHYTVGQRRGLGLAWPESLYVLSLAVEQNALIVGEQRYLWQNELVAEDIHWIAEQAPDPAQTISAKIRYAAPAAAVTLLPWRKTATG